MLDVIFPAAVRSLEIASLTLQTDEWELDSDFPAHPPEPGTATMGAQRALRAPTTWHTGHIRTADGSNRPPDGGRS